MLLLIKWEADMNERNYANRTAVGTARLHGNWNIVELIHKKVGARA